MYVQLVEVVLDSETGPVVIPNVQVHFVLGGLQMRWREEIVHEVLATIIDFVVAGEGAAAAAGAGAARVVLV
jgi:hypothetical protein